MLINEELGSYFFIGTLLTSLENDIAPTEVADRCGTCTRCIDACPTDAILPNRTVASEHCISYATIEHRGPLGRASHARTATPSAATSARKSAPGTQRPPRPSGVRAARRVSRHAGQRSSSLRRRRTSPRSSGKSAVKRAKLAGMQRNVEAITADRDGTRG